MIHGVYVDGPLTVRAWLDLPSTKRVPLALQRDVPEVERSVSA